jgi:hypothetical protein
LRAFRGLAANFVLGSSLTSGTTLDFAGKSAVIVVQAATPGNENRFEPFTSLTLFMEALPMIAPKNLAEGTEFIVTIVVSAVAGLLAFLLVLLIVNILGL